MKDKFFKTVSEALQGRNLPLVVLDNKWHQLFNSEFKTKSMQSLEKQINKTLQEQGKLNNDLKEYKTAKKKLMDTIIGNMNDIPAEDTKGFLKKEKKMDASQKLIYDLNDKIEYSKKRLDEIPSELRDLNNRLIAQGISLCYDTIEANNKELEYLDAWIEATRAELREKVARKQDMEEINTHIYSYVHDVLGREILDEIDLKYEDRNKE